MPNLRSESFGVSEKQSWLGSAHGIWNARTVRLLVSAFTGDHAPDGFIPAGTQLTTDAEGAYVPYTGAGVFEGFLRTDQSLLGGDETTNAPLLDHGRVNVDQLPFAFVVPAPENDNTTFVYLNAERAGDTTGGEG